MKPNLFIVGAPKAGTTSLHYYLSQHPDVCMSTVKEPNFFSAEEIGDLYYGTVPVRSQTDYEALFERSARVTGEASVSYLYYENVAQRLKDFNPSAKIIIILRDPVARALSHHKMDCRLGFCNVSLNSVLDEPERYPAYFRQFVELGDYFNQVTRYLQVFGPDAVLILKYEQLKEDPLGFMAAVFDFLGLYTIAVDLEPKNQALVPNNAFIGALYRSKLLRAVAKRALPGTLARTVERNLFRGRETDVDSLIRSRLRKRYESNLFRLAEVVDFDISEWLHSASDIGTVRK